MKFLAPPPMKEQLFKPMKLTAVFVLCILFLTNCEQKDEETLAEEYMNQVVGETYEEMYLPDLEPEDISYLLTFRNDKSILKKFPVNPISSFLLDSVTVGIIALWTVESIRISELSGDKSAFERFPSLNPMIKDTTGAITNSFSLQEKAAGLYQQWWGKPGLDSDKKQQINPLEKSGIIWF